MAYQSEQYAAVNELSVYNKPTSGKKVVNKVLLGTWLGVVGQSGDYYEVETAGPDGWVKKKDVTQDKHLKVFYIDNGQGDAVLLEVGNLRVIIDGGPQSHLRNYLAGWQYSHLLDDDKQVHIDYVFVSHFDADHYFGLTPIISDERFTFGTVYHNGIARFNTSKGKRPAKYNRDLGKTIKHNGEEYLTTSFDSLSDLTSIKNGTGLQRGFKKFTEALEKADAEGRLSKVQSLNHTIGAVINQTINGMTFKIDIVGPVLSKVSGKDYFKWLDNSSSHTRNGHSLVMRIEYGNSSLLFGGDLNTASEEHLMDHYGTRNPFRVDVNKCCHHGSSDFSVGFLRKVLPLATVISSGDNESHAHPRADTLGCAGKYTRGVRPKVYSTELARSINSGGDILYGMINLRSDGKRIYMAQMKEKRSGVDLWDSYKIK